MFRPMISVLLEVYLKYRSTDLWNINRYVKTVPLAAQILDVRKHQKLEMIEELKLDKAKYRLEVEIGKSPPLSDDEMWLELRHKA